MLRLETVVENRADALFRFELQRPAGRFAELLQNRQPQPDLAAVVLARLGEKRIENPPEGTSLLELMLRFDLCAMAAAGVQPDFSGYDRTEPWSAFSVASGSFEIEEPGRLLRVDREVAEWLHMPSGGKKRQILLDAARVIGVFYQFHLDCAVEARREVLKLISHNDNEKA
jgi:hypothetical protein